MRLWLAAALLLRFDLRDTESVRHTQAELLESRASVVVFIGSACPISNRYLPELARLASLYGSRGVRFFAVNSEASGAGSHARAYSIPFPVLLDPTQQLARSLGATATPEAAVLSPAGRLLYRGRIDDRYVDFGKERTAPARHDLQMALDAVLAGRAAPAFTKVVGCAIEFAKPAAAGPVTFSRDVAPILYRNCAACHRPGASGPFPLLSYQDAAARAGLIARVTASRYMPPWKPEPGYGEFAGARGLTAAEIATLARWAAAGAPQGDPAGAPSPPAFASGWQLGPPDAVVEMRQPFQVPAGGPDLYQCFSLPLPAGGERYVRAVEFRPGNPRVLHHALLFTDSSGAGRRLEKQPGESYSCFGTPGFLPGAGLGGWSPGAPAMVWPEGVSTPVHADSGLVVQLHFHPTGKPETVRASIGLYFTSQPPRRPLMDVALTSNRIDIPPGARDYTVNDHFTLPVDVEAVGIIPHAHYVCREMKGWATLPDGTRRWLLWIRDWDFNWQDQYRYREPLRLPAGTRVEMAFTYDNSEANPRNPNHPPRRVAWGAGSGDEMAGLHLQVLPVRAEDAHELGLALWGKIMRSVGGGFYRRPE